MTQNKKKVILRGPLLSRSGYGVHSRQIARWLFDRSDRLGNLEIFCEPLPWGITPWITDMDEENGLIGRIVQSSIPSDGFDVSIQVQLPNEWNPFLANYNVGVTAGVEANKCNPEWVAAVNRMQQVIVPSSFTKKCFENTGEIKTNISVIGESFIDEILDDSIEPLELDIDTEFNFLVFGQITGNNPENDRKNIFYTLKWIFEEFKDKKDVGIILKTNTGRDTVLDKINVSSILSQVVAETKQSPFPKLHLLHGHMTNKEIAGLYKSNKVKAIVNLGHGEGFGIPVLEAAASGLPVIATNWSGYLDFLSLGKFIKVDCSVNEVHQTRVDGQIYQPGFKWAYADADQAKRCLKKFYESSAMPKQWASELKNPIREKYSFSAISAQYDDFFKEKL